MENPSITPAAFLKELEFLFQKYSEELRATTQPFNLKKARNHLSDYRYHPEDAMIRETLMEHVGSLRQRSIRTLTIPTSILDAHSQC